jgi:hypothetical protein
MIVEDFDVMRVTTMKFETDAPPRVHIHSPLTSAVALQPMKADAAERSQVRWCPGYVKRKQQVDSGFEIQSSEPVWFLAFPNLAACTVGPRSDHGRNVLRCAVKTRRAA